MPPLNLATSMLKFLRTAFLCLLSATALALNAAVGSVPPAEQLLPADTLALATIPDWDAACAQYEKLPQSRLWNDPALRAFKEKFSAHFQEEYLAPIEKQLGIKFSDYADLLHGQATLALLKNGWDGKSAHSPAFVLLLDAKNKADLLSQRLAEFKKKWTDAGKLSRAENIHGIPFAILVLKKADFESLFDQAGFGAKAKAPKPNADTPEKAVVELAVGQSGSLLIVGTAPKEIEQIIVHQTGGPLPALADEAVYQSNHAAMFRHALGFVWVSFQPIYSAFTQRFSQTPPDPNSALSLDPLKILNAIGLDSIKTLALSFSADPGGMSSEFFVGSPDANRHGLFRILTTESKDASPPAFVPADVTKFSRWRVDGQKAWTTLQSALQAINPALVSSLNGVLGMIGKDKDPDFDFKRVFFGNLGDDFISYQKAPRSATVAGLNSPPTLFLIGSGNPEKLVEGLRAGIVFLPVVSPGAPLAERDFLGRKIYSIPLRAPGQPAQANDPERVFSFSASSGYLAISTDPSILEEFLRSSGGVDKSLRDLQGVADAAQKTGAMDHGMFAYENQRLVLQAAVNATKNDRANLEKILSMAFNLPQMSGESGGKKWLDLSLLPPFDQIAKYFSFVVYASNSRPEGLSWKFFSPTPPELR